VILFSETLNQWGWEKSWDVIIPNISADPPVTQPSLTRVLWPIYPITGWWFQTFFIFHHIWE
jgi:hypothetical protein